MELKEWLDSQLAMDIWKRKYQFENENFEEWLDRISGNDNELKEIIKEKKFLFGGRILANRGLHKKGKKITYSNCYVIPAPEDNLESIFDIASKLARTYSYGGGCGIDISKLCPAESKVNNAAEHSSGAVSFMDLYSLITELISQNGRRGALMLSILCTHPDLLKFIDIKNDLDKVTKANISIRILNDFMEAVKDDRDWVLYFKRNETNEMITYTYPARDIYRKICENNWNMAEPGMLFWDRITDWNLVSEDKEFEYAGTNPCAEEPLPAGGSCLLGSINLSEFVKNPFTDNAIFDFDEFNKCVEKAVVALDKVLDEGLPLHPLQIQRDTVRDWRQIGLGIMGLSDLLIKLNLKYGSKESIDLCDEIGFNMANTSIRTSAMLSQQNGTYPKYKKEAISNSAFFKYNTDEETKRLVENYGLRHSQLLTIAPTGSLSTMLGISGGIEPIYNISYVRKTESLHEKDVYYKVYTPIAIKYMSIHNLTEEEQLSDIFVTAMTLNYKDRIDMQSVWQKHIDASISSTVNVPTEFSIEDTENLYMYAWEQNLKGVTIYRDKCSRSGILSTDDIEESKDIKAKTELPRGFLVKVDDSLIGKKRKLQTGCGSLHVEAFFSPDTGDMMEVFLSKGSSGGCNSFMVGLSRMISISLRGGIPVESIVDQLGSVISCPSYVVRQTVKHDTSTGKCCPDAIGKSLLEMQNEMWKEVRIEDEEELSHAEVENKVIKTTTNNNSLSEKDLEFIKIHGEIDFAKKFNRCPLCGYTLHQEGGCVSCINDGWSRCD